MLFLRKLITALYDTIDKLEARVQVLERQVGLTSANSSKSPFK